MGLKWPDLWFPPINLWNVWRQDMKTRKEIREEIRRVDSKARHCTYFDAGWCYHPLSPEPFGCVGCANCDFCTSKLEEKMKDDQR